MADSSPDLAAPLLRGADVVVDVDVDLAARANGKRETAQELGNPFEFLCAPMLSEAIRPPWPVDPFRNHTPGLGGVYGWVKLILCVPLVLVRLALFGIAILLGYVATSLALQGWKDRQSPMPAWRNRLMWVTRLSARLILFSFGYHWIKRTGRPASRESAPIVVSNHVSYVDPIFFFYELFPTIVAAESHDAIPFVGTIIRAMQVIYVDRFSPDSRKHAINEIKRKASCNEFPRVLLFPEGTTTNGRSLLSFQLGAFIHGFPVQPVVVRYPHVHFDQSWGNISLAMLMLKMLIQFHNFMEVEYLPVIVPGERKEENAVKFSEQTSFAMASALNVVQTSYSFADVLLLTKAMEYSKLNFSRYMVEMAWVESSFNVSTSEAMEFLDRFLAMNPDSSDRVGIHNFSTVLALGQGPLAEKIFSYLDVEKQGSITFRQFLIGSALVRKQPLFLRACEAVFDKLDPDRTEGISVGQLGDSIQVTAVCIDYANLHQLHNLLDMDNDGAVGRTDFMTCLRKNPLLIALFYAGMGITNSLENV